jgi:hypothetical protein
LRKEEKKGELFAVMEFDREEQEVDSVGGSVD